MSRILVVTSPAHDAITAYFDAWMSKAVGMALQQPETSVIELSGASANREALAKAIKENEPRLVILNGHGNASEMCGFDNEVLIRCDDNEQSLNGRILHMLACDTGDKLGPRCVQIGSLAYIGYTKPFKLVCQSQTTRETRLGDTVAAMVLDPAFEAVIALIQGATVAEAFDRSREQHKAVLRTLDAIGDSELNQLVGSRVFHNLMCQVQLGDGAARF